MSRKSVLLVACAQLLVLAYGAELEYYVAHNPSLQKNAEDYTTCSKGLHQSPIALETSIALQRGASMPGNVEGTAVTQSMLDFGLRCFMTKYEQGTDLAITNLESSFQIVVDGNSTLFYEGIEYKLTKAFLRVPGEHHIDGRRPEMELQVFHEGGKEHRHSIVALSVGIIAGDQNPEWKTFLDALPLKGESKVQKMDGALNSLFPANPNYLRYDGSLTVDPCLEGVTWLVMAEYLTVEAMVIENLKQKLSASYTPRTTQPHHQRIVLQSRINGGEEACGQIDGKGGKGYRYRGTKVASEDDESQMECQNGATMDTQTPKQCTVGIEKVVTSSMTMKDRWRGKWAQQCNLEVLDCNAGSLDKQACRCVHADYSESCEDCESRYAGVTLTCALAQDDCHEAGSWDADNCKCPCTYTHTSEAPEENFFKPVPHGILPRRGLLCQECDKTSLKDFCKAFPLDWHAVPNVDTCKCEMKCNSNTMDVPFWKHYVTCDDARDVTDCTHVERRPLGNDNSNCPRESGSKWGEGDKGVCTRNNGNCLNGGTLDMDTCTCMCPPPFYGETCSSCGHTADHCNGYSVKDDCTCDCDKNLKMLQGRKLNSAKEGWGSLSLVTLIADEVSFEYTVKEDGASEHKDLPVFTLLLHKGPGGDEEWDLGFERKACALGTNCEQTPFEGGTRFIFRERVSLMAKPHAFEYMGQVLALDAKNIEHTVKPVYGWVPVVIQDTETLTGWHVEPKSVVFGSTKRVTIALPIMMQGVAQSLTIHQAMYEREKEAEVWVANTDWRTDEPGPQDGATGLNTFRYSNEPQLVSEMKKVEFGKDGTGSIEISWPSSAQKFRDVLPLIVLVYQDENQVKTPIGSVAIIEDAAVDRERNKWCMNPHKTVFCEQYPYCENYGELDSTSCTCTKCQGMFEGARCERCAIDGTSSSVCMHGGTFDQITCRCYDCFPGWTGPLCDICDLAGRDIRNGGYLDPGTCGSVCTANWKGRMCDQCSLTNDACSPGGEVDTQTCSCICKGAWTGKLCDKCDTSLVSRCKYRTEHTTLSKLTCKCLNCQRGWKGDMCQEADTADETSSLCANQGVRDGNGICNCGRWSGAACEDCGILSCGNGYLDKEACQCKCYGHWTRNPASGHCSVCSLKQSDCKQSSSLNEKSCRCDKNCKGSGDLCEKCSDNLNVPVADLRGTCALRGYCRDVPDDASPIATTKCTCMPPYGGDNCEFKVSKNRCAITRLPELFGFHDPLEGGQYRADLSSLEGSKSGVYTLYTDPQNGEDIQVYLGRTRRQSFLTVVGVCVRKHDDEYAILPGVDSQWFCKGNSKKEIQGSTYGSNTEIRTTSGAVVTYFKGSIVLDHWVPKRTDHVSGGMCATYDKLPGDNNNFTPESRLQLLSQHRVDEESSCFQSCTYVPVSLNQPEQTFDPIGRCRDMESTTKLFDNYRSQTRSPTTALPGSIRRSQTRACCEDESQCASIVTSSNYVRDRTDNPDEY